jgi:hypothetical protein
VGHTFALLFTLVVSTPATKDETEIFIKSEENSITGCMQNTKSHGTEGVLYEFRVERLWVPPSLLSSG